MSSTIDAKHAKLLAEVIDQSTKWQLQPEKKTPFKSTDEAFAYIEAHNEPLYILVAVNDSEEEVMVKASTEGDDVLLQTVSMQNMQEAKVHHSHLKLVESTVTELVNAQLSDGKKAASF